MQIPPIPPSVFIEQLAAYSHDPRFAEYFRIAGQQPVSADELRAGAEQIMAKFAITPPPEPRRDAASPGDVDRYLALTREGQAALREDPNYVPLADVPGAANREQLDRYLALFPAGAALLRDRAKAAAKGGQR